MLRSILFAVLLIVVPSIAAEGVMKAPDETFSGKIAAASKTVVAVVTRQGENISFIIGADCKITRDGKPVGAEMLGIGDAVNVSAVEDGDKHVAKTIMARSATQPAAD